MTNQALVDAVLDCIVKGDRRFSVGGTDIFQGITETDLANALRDRRWRLPRGWLSEVESAGFTVKQVYQYSGEVRTHFEEAPQINPATGKPFKYDSFQRRKLDEYVTIISA